MNILIAPDSFKDSLSAAAVAKCMAKAVRTVQPQATIKQLPISDGGEGLLEVLFTPLGSEVVHVQVRDPLSRDISATYLILDNGQTAVIELAKASGLELLRDSERDPMHTSTYGTGQMIKDALDRGCRRIIIGLGGSATNDGGLGMIKALGGQFLDDQGRSIGEGGGALAELHQIDTSKLDKRLAATEIIGACDVNNPLTGPKGASKVYGGQKGGNARSLEQLDNALSNYAKIISSNLEKNISKVAGTGAAGGTGMALLAFLNADLKPGIDLIMEELRLEEHIQQADIVLTGEGRIDDQTLNGKSMMGIARRAQKHKVPVIAVAGSIDVDEKALHQEGITSVFSIIDKPMDLKDAIHHTDVLIESCLKNIFRLMDF